MIPRWATDLVAALAGTIAKLISARSDAEREEAAMEAAEATKAALDRARWPNG